MLSAHNVIRKRQINITIVRLNIRFSKVVTPVNMYITEKRLKTIKINIAIL
jgi:hypothetical protein